MRKSAFFVIFFLSIFILNMNTCYADIYRGKITGTGVRVRSGPGTNYDAIFDLTKGNEYTLVDNNKYNSEAGCAAGWYKINYDLTNSGYVCSDYVEVSTITINEETESACENELKAKGFPSTYWKDLCLLKAIHPAWKFTPIFTGLDFTVAVSKESACGKSYIATSNEEYIDRSCHNQYTSTWYPASNKAVAYYMDPRNWFKENTIFQFEGLVYNTALDSVYAGAANYSIRNAAFYKYHNNLGNNLGEVINNVGRDTSVSATFLASRMLQELGSKETLYNLYSGVYAGNGGIYAGYYNFYNMGVSDSCATSEGTTVCGLRYAYNNGWNSLYNSIKGGASQIYNNYVAKGQYTTYSQKYNVHPSNASSLYLHQYMTNVAAPSSESKTTYNAYKNQNILDNGFEFFIPVYLNIDSSITNSSNGAVSSNDEESLTTINLSTIITSSGYTRDGKYIRGIKPGSLVSSIKADIESIAGSGNVLIKNSTGNQVIDGKVGTGYIVEVKNEEGSLSLTVIVKGDTSGDGEINALDLLQVQKNILGTYTLNDVYKLAGDTSKDNQINALDLLQVQKHILGTYVIS